MKLQPQSNMFLGTVDFWATEENYNNQRSIGQPVTMVLVDEGSGSQEPTFRLRDDEVQELFERLWGLGFRSRQDKGNADKLDQARQEHLADLRKAAKLS